MSVAPCLFKAQLEFIVGRFRPRSRSTGPTLRPFKKWDLATMSDRSGLINKTVNQLRSRIVAGEWQIGERIPTEMSVAMGRHLEDAHYTHVLEVRRSLEVEAARLAASRRTDQDVVELRAVNKVRQEAFAGEDVDLMVQADMALHSEIARISQNPVLSSLYDSLTDSVQATIRHNVELILRSSVSDDHDDLIEAIAMGDQFLAMEEMGSYLETYIDGQPE